MRRSFIIFAGIGMIVSGCRTHPSVSETASASVPETSKPAVSPSRIVLPLMQVPPSRVGAILVIISAGPVTNKGEHWFPEGATLATVLDWAGLDSVYPPRRVFVFAPDGHGVECRVAGRPRQELEQVTISHGTRILVPWDRCFGLGPNEPAAPNAGIAPRLTIGHHWPGVGEPGRSVTYTDRHSPGRTSGWPEGPRHASPGQASLRASVALDSPIAEPSEP